METQQDNERLTRVGPGTPMGELLRRYWHPIAATSELDDEPVKYVKILGEELVLYRDRSGTYGLMAEKCPHRRASMVFGVPEEEGLRCPYHGWRFDETGRCVEQPYEETEDPDGRFKDKVRITAYPVEELSGLLFTYMGPQPAPLVPRWDLFVREDVIRDVGLCILPCNWLQMMENSLDPVHLEWLHQHFDNYVLERLGRGDQKRPRIPHKKVGFSLFEHGIVKRRVWGDSTEEDEDWAVGHPVLFPNILRVGARGSYNFQFRVPVDDENTLHIYYTAYAIPEGMDAPKQESVPWFEVPVETWDRRKRPKWDLLDSNSGQDMTMWFTQGAIADRTEETLGRSDKGIIMFRRLLKEQMELVEQGQEPTMNVFRDPAQNQHIVLPQEEQRADMQGYYAVGEGQRRQGHASKYSPTQAEVDALFTQAREKARAQTGMNRR